MNRTMGHWLTERELRGVYMRGFSIGVAFGAVVVFAGALLLL